MSGYRDCACRDCFEIAGGEEGALCWACVEAGCEPESECQAPHAYCSGAADADGEGADYCSACGQPW